jgi:uncharacterized protein (DUF1810 family)
MNDPHHLNRFLLAQQDDYERTLAEVKNGRRRTHWMWYIFAQIDGLGFSSMARRYGIKSADETRAYLAHPVLGSRLLASTEAVVANVGSDATEIFGSPDDLKLRSSATLFASVAAPDSVFHRLLEKFYAGGPDKETLRLLGISNSVEGSTFAVHRPPAQSGGVRTVSLLLFRAAIDARTIWRPVEFKRDTTVKGRYYMSIICC